MKQIKKYSKIPVLALAVLLTGCEKEDPEEEHDHEIMTDVELIFTNDADSSDVVIASAVDPDGEGIEKLQIKNAINLDTGKTYTLTFGIWNKLEDDHDDHDDEGENIAEEIEGEDDEHQFFFSFPEGAFSNPTGNGNIDNASDAINYLDKDANGHNVGLSTSWTTSTDAKSGKFKVILMHQPDVKTATSGIDKGDADFELEFEINIK